MNDGNTPIIYVIKVSGSYQSIGHLQARRLYVWAEGDEYWAIATYISGVKRLSKVEKLEVIAQISLGVIPDPMPLILYDWKHCHRYGMTYYGKITSGYVLCKPK